MTAEAAPHHFSLTDGCAAGYDPVFKVNPPLRPQADVEAVKAGLADGTIDAIATDHAPHAPELKDLPFDQAPPGMLGLQTALSLAVSELGLPLAQVLALLSWQPAAICRLDPANGGGQGGPVVPGSAANLCVIDPTSTWTVEPVGPGQPEPELALRGPEAHRTGPPHRLPGRAGGRRRRGPAVTGRNGIDPRAEALLVLADGTRFEGEAIGAEPEGGITTGEAVFNTVLSGYQEVITDPSYAGQVIAFTYPHIGNYGVNPTDDEASRPHCRGVIVRELTDRPSSWRSTETLEEFLVRFSACPASPAIDTRRLTRHLRQPGRHAVRLRHRCRSPSWWRRPPRPPRPTGGTWCPTVTTAAAYTRGTGPYRVVAYDFGIKEAMLRQLGELATVTVVPASTSADEVLGLEPDGIFLSNGPGDPAALPGHRHRDPGAGRATAPCRCSGSVSATSCWPPPSAATTYKLPFGHHGGNHPVRRVSTGRVEITSQNHNYAVAEGSLAPADVTHVNLNDGVVEGVASRQAPVFSVQYHPEAGPGAPRRPLPVRGVPGPDGRHRGRRRTGGHRGGG